MKFLPELTPWFTKGATASCCRWSLQTSCLPLFKELCVYNLSPEPSSDGWNSSLLIHGRRNKSKNDLVKKDNLFKSYSSVHDTEHLLKSFKNTLEPVRLRAGRWRPAPCVMISRLIDHLLLWTSENVRIWKSRTVKKFTLSPVTNICFRPLEISWGMFTNSSCSWCLTSCRERSHLAVAMVTCKITCEENGNLNSFIIMKTEQHFKFKYHLFVYLFTHPFYLIYQGVLWHRQHPTFPRPSDHSDQT